MMKRIKNIFKMTLVLALMLTTFSGTAAIQAAGPRAPYHWDQRDDRNRHHDWDKDHRDRDEKKNDNANKKINWALGLAAVAAVVAIAK